MLWLIHLWISVSLAQDCKDLFAPSSLENTLSQVNSSIIMTPSEMTLHFSNESGFQQKLDMLTRATPGTTVNMAYFIYEGDYSSSYFSYWILRKADEGVKFRILIDHAMAESQYPILAALNSHPGVLVKTFRPQNPEFISFLEKSGYVKDPILFTQALVSQDISKIQNSLEPEFLARIATDFSGVDPAVTVDVLAHLSKIQKDFPDKDFFVKLSIYFREYSMRLHHKELIVETDRGLEFITGGRNISDEYHSSLDGPAGEFLNDRSYPFYDAEISLVTKSTEQKAQIENAYENLWQESNSQTLKLESTDYISTLQEKAQVYANTIVKFNVPLADSLSPVLMNLEKTTHESKSHGHSSQHQVAWVENRPQFNGALNDNIHQSWEQVLENVRPGQKIIILSAYVFLDKNTFPMLQTAMQRGASVEIYTNSYDTTDLNVVNLAAYKNMSVWLGNLGSLSSQIHFFEMKKPDTGKGSLHAKTMAILNEDQSVEWLWIGSANEDPRSRLLDSNDDIFMHVDASSDLGKDFLNFYQIRVTAGKQQLSLQPKMIWLEVSPAYIADKTKNLSPKEQAILQLMDLEYFSDQL